MSWISCSFFFALWVHTAVFIFLSHGKRICWFLVSGSFRLFWHCQDIYPRSFGMDTISCHPVCLRAPYCNRNLSNFGSVFVSVIGTVCCLQSFSRYLNCQTPKKNIDLKLSLDSRLSRPKLQLCWLLKSKIRTKEKKKKKISSEPMKLCIFHWSKSWKHTKIICIF